MLKLRTKAYVLAAAAALFVCVVAAVVALLPAQTSLVRDEWNYGYVYSGAKSQSTAFVTADMREGDMLLFGSSELSTPPSLVPEVPAVVFGRNNYGLQLACVGEAFDQSLWHAIAAGAYAPHVSNKRVAIIVSPSWFFDGGVDNSVFQTRFSYPLYRAFMRNEALSDDVRTYVSRRLTEQGVDNAVVRAPRASNPAAAINDLVFSAIADLKLRNSLRALEGTGIERVDANDEAKVLTPPFAKWRKHALEDAAARSTNEWGFDDGFYAENVGEYKDQIKDRLAGETFADTPEYDDFGLFLRVCQETGLEPLVVVSPLSGTYYDWVGIDEQTRRSCYDHIIEICNAYGVQVANFSDKEYETYFLNDQVHFGWTGWVDVEEAIYAFAKEGEHA